MIVIGAVNINDKRKDACTKKPFSKEHCLCGGLVWIGDEINGTPQARILEGYVSPISTNGTEGKWRSHLGESQRQGYIPVAISEKDSKWGGAEGKVKDSAEEL